MDQPSLFKRIRKLGFVLFPPILFPDSVGARRPQREWMQRSLSDA